MRSILRYKLGGVEKHIIMKHTITKRISWKTMLASAGKPVLLPAAHDAMTARLTADKAINMDEFMKIVDLPFWAAVEEKFESKNV